MEVEKLMNDTILFLTETQQKLDTTIWNSSYNYMHPKYDRRGKWEENIYYKLDEKSLEKYITQIEKDLNTHNDIPIEEFDKIVERAADKTLMSKYKKKITKE